MARRVEITSDLEDISPALAEFYLSKNENNRPVRKRMVDAFTRDMKAGKWNINGDAIRFGSGGQLLDGQHRLMAIIASGRTIKTFVIRGLNGRVQETMDLGAKRSFGDMLRLRGEEYYSALASITRMHWIMVNTANPLHRAIQPTIQELIAHLDKNPDIRRATKLSKDMWNNLKVPPSAVGPVLYQGFSIDEEDTLFFAEKLTDGINLNADSPILVLRKFLIKHGQQEESLRVEVLMGYVIKAWNAYREGASVENLRFRSGGATPETYPVMK